jgi:hypothetical protein
MTVRILAITGLTLVTLTAVALMPVALSQPEPRSRLPAPEGLQPAWFLVRSATGLWYLNGAPVSEASLAAQLQTDASHGGVRFLPSDALSSQTVSTTLAWLRGKSRQPVRLELVSGRP